nr:hypothetical protein [Paracoccus sp. PAMC 22219]
MTGGLQLDKDPALIQRVTFLCDQPGLLHALEEMNVRAGIKAKFGADPAHQARRRFEQLENHQVLREGKTERLQKPPVHPHDPVRRPVECERELHVDLAAGIAFPAYLILGLN